MKKMLPPANLLFCLLLAIGLHLFVPVIQIIPEPFHFSGAVLMAVGAWFNIWTDMMFKEAGTTVKPFETPTALLTDGPFTISRHPMYLGMIMILLGGAIFLGSLTAFIAPVVFFVVVNTAFISHEERSMEERFGQEYLDYKERVRRWI